MAWEPEEFKEFEPARVPTECWYHFSCGGVFRYFALGVYRCDACGAECCD